MHVSTKGRYALRAMLDLALQSKESPTLVRDICERQGISNLYMEQLLARLKTAGFVRSIRGPNGGFLLAKPPSRVKVIDILQAMEGSTAPVECVDNAAVCPRAESCTARTMWVEMKKAIDKVVGSTTLEDLAKQEKQRLNINV